MDQDEGVDLEGDSPEPVAVLEDEVVHDLLVGVLLRVFLIVMVV